MDDELVHIGIPRRSGRYPWGSGQDPQRSKSWLSYVHDLHNQGVSYLEIAKGQKMSTSDLRRKITIEKAAERAVLRSEVLKLLDKGISTSEVGRRLGKNESSIRDLINPVLHERSQITTNIAKVLKDEVDKYKYIDVSLGVESHLGVSRTKLKTSIKMLKDQGYEEHDVYQEQLGKPGKYTTISVLVPPGVTKREAYAHRYEIKLINYYSEDSGRNILGIEPPKNIDSKRIFIKYGKEGGKDKDGLIELRRGVDDLSFVGNKHYAQVRIGVDNTHYLKGMAIYSNNVPKGFDIIYNTKKESGTPKEDVFKSNKDEPDNPFGAIVRQRKYLDANGKEQLSALNVVGTEKSANEEGTWSTYKRTISSQMLSKQTPALAKKQLGLALDIRNEQFDELKTLTNPAVKKRLLDSFADDADGAATHLAGAALPRQSWHVLLTFDSIKENEIFAPNFDDGEPVVLIRHPHGGIFEIPELRVNNKNKEAISIIGNHAQDGVGVHPKVAAKLSGADFDGDTVLVISNKNREIKIAPSLKALKDFDPQISYKNHSGVKRMTPEIKGKEMGDISNLITDMTIKGANPDEIARAVRHSMVIIDAEKHGLDYKQSAIDNNIPALKKIYQGGERSGAATLISRANSDLRVPHRKERGVTTTPIKIDPKTGKVYGNTDPLTGKKVYNYTGETYKVKKVVIDPTTGKKTYIDTGRTKPRLTMTKKMAEEENAFALISDNGGTRIEEIYAGHANALKDLGNRARKASLDTKYNEPSPSAKTTYKKEVDSLNAQLNIVLYHKPLERQAQLMAAKTVSAKRQANPSLKTSDIKKLRGQAIAETRTRFSGGKEKIIISDREWEAIQAGAISKSKLTQILLNTDVKSLKERALPRTSIVMSPARLSRARTMFNSGCTRAEIASALGISISSLDKALE